MNYGRTKTYQKRLKLQSKAARKRQSLQLNPVKFAALVVLIIAIICLAVVGFIFKSILDKTPQITPDSLKPSTYTTTAYANDGKTVLGTFVSEGSNRVYKTIDEIPEDLQDAFIAVEDSRFRDHKGIDVKGITRAAITGITSGNFSQGGSTITQQLIKNQVFKDFPTETKVEKVERKIQEINLALQVEKIMDKDMILEYYLNAINLGQNTLGVQAASQRYFGKDVSELTLSECATIAAITKSPSGYNPITNAEANAKRRTKVLDDMLEQKLISQEEYDAAIADDVYSRIQAANTAYLANQKVNSYFVDEVAKAVIKDLCEDLNYSETAARDAVYSGGLKIITTQDVAMQKICEEEINNNANYPAKTKWTVTGAISVAHVDGTQNHYDHNNFGNYIKKKYKVEYGTTFSSQEEANAKLQEYISTISTESDQIFTNITLSPQPQSSIVVMDQYTGHVKAMVGGRGEKTGNMSLNRATQSARQPGSCFKVLSTFVPALDVNGDTLATTILDAPYSYKSGEPVHNHWSGYRGTLTIRYCIQQSANVCTVKKYTDLMKLDIDTGDLDHVGLDYLINKFKFTTLDKVNDSGQATSLGGITNGVYNIEMTAAFASIANNGVYTEPILYTKIYDHDGNLLHENIPSTHVAMKDTTAALITSAMKDVVTSGTGTLTRLSGMTSAGKTGTTTDDRDFWFSGYTPYLTASVWGGFDDNQSMSGSSSFHKVIWRKAMQRIHDTYDYKSVNFAMPDSITRKTICKETGLLASSDACTKYTEYFASGTAPKKSCPGHAAVPPQGGTTTPATPTP